MNIEGLIHRGMLAARALGFVFLIYFIPVFIRDLVGEVLPGGGILSLLRGTSVAPAFPFVLSIVTGLLSVGAVLLYSRNRPDAIQPRPLLRFDGKWRRRWLFGLAGGMAIVGGAHVPLFALGVVRFEGFSATILERPFMAIAILG